MDRIELPQKTPQTCDWWPSSEHLALCERDGSRDRQVGQSRAEKQVKRGLEAANIGSQGAQATWGGQAEELLAVLTLLIKSATARA